MTMVPWLIDNPSIGYVQARWAFTNPEESYLTKVCCVLAEAPHELATYLAKKNPATCIASLRAEMLLEFLHVEGRCQLFVLDFPDGCMHASAAFVGAAGAADLPQLPLQVRAICALCQRRLL